MLEGADQEGVVPRPEVYVAIVVADVGEGRPAELLDLLVGEEEVLGREDGDPHGRVAELAQRPGPDSGAVDEVVALDLALLGPHAHHLDLPVGDAVIGQDLLHAAAPHEAGALAVGQESQGFGHLLRVDGGIAGYPDACV